MKNFILRTAVSILFIGLLVYLIRDDFPLVLDTLRRMRRGLLGISALLFLGTVFILAKRLQIIFAAENIAVSWGRCSNLTFIGYFFNNFLPTAVGGDIVKALCASRITGEPVKSVSSVLMDRIFGLFTFILIPSFSFLFIARHIGNNPAVPVVIYSFLAFSVFCFLLLFNQSVARRFSFMRHFLNYIRLLDKARKVYERLHNFKNHKTVIFQAMALSLLGQSLGIFVLYLLGVALGAQASPFYFFLLVPIVHLVSMLPSLNGLGIREGAYAYFLTPVVGKQCAVALGILYLGLLIMLSVIGGVIYLVRHDYHVRLSGRAKEEAVL